MIFPRLYFTSIFFVSFTSAWRFVFIHPSPTCCQNFLLFGNVLFCLYCLTLSWYLLSLPSFTDKFWFISPCSVVRFVCGCLFGIFSFCSLPVCHVFFCSFTCHSFFICPSIQVLYFNFFGGFLLYDRQVLLRQRLTHSVRWCCPLRYIAIIYLLFRCLP